MKVLWAPWRMDYIRSGPSKKKGCVFCKGLAEKNDEKNLVVYRGDLIAVFLNRYPYNNGHLLVMPKRHISSFSEFDEKEALEMHDVLCLSLDVLRTVMNPAGFNIGINLGKVAGAGILDHIHYHIVPRWNGDTNFMPVLAELKVMPEHLAVVYKKLKKAFKEEEDQK